MAIGPNVRRMFGPLEGRVSELYRGMFVNLDDFARCIRQWAPASAILEFGCGEGALAQRLAQAYPEASITGIDISPHVGRLFSGDRRRVAFQQVSLDDFAPRHCSTFDLVVICDVMHHIPWDLHRALMEQIRSLLKPGGVVVLKDWVRTGTPIYWLGYGADRYITGDRIRYRTAEEWREYFEGLYGPSCIREEVRIRPWKNNLAFLIRPAKDGCQP